MRPWWMVVVLVGCESGTPPPDEPSPPPQIAAPVAADSAVVASDAETAVAQTPIDASVDAPRVDVRPSVRAAPPQIARVYHENPKLGSESIATNELRREGDQAWRAIPKDGSVNPPE